MKVIKLLDDKLEEILLIVLLVAMACIMGIQVFCRYVLNFSLSWSEELTRYMFIWSCFISISYCIKRWISIKVDQVINMFPKKAYVFAQLLLNILLFVLFFYLSIHGYKFLSLQLPQNRQALLYNFQCHTFNVRHLLDLFWPQYVLFNKLYVK